ncbi:DUF6812 domain-containing protein [Coleofasciculus sp. F4-SAH-05]|uniref:DUF6812 domain-containing protein n=1 Tax=Coleofasciculus sp. F4-SAH-05 TaxID=3069525 RepID=UPI004063F0F1
MLIWQEFQNPGKLTINIPLNGYSSSSIISDLLNSSRNFITLTDVEVYSENQPCFNPFSVNRLIYETADHAEY